MAENTAAATRLIVADTGATEKLQVVITREHHGRQTQFCVNGLLARTNDWLGIKRFGYLDDPNFAKVGDSLRPLFHDLLGDTGGDDNLAIKSIEFGANRIMPNIDAEYMHLLPYFARMVLDHLSRAFERELEVFICEDKFFSLSLDSKDEDNKRGAQQDRLHLQLLKQTFPKATIVRNLEALERLRLGIAPRPADAVPAE